LTIPHHMFTPYLPRGVVWIKGQLEAGSEGGYLHWQVVVAFDEKKRLSSVKITFGDGIHAELSKSSAANAYVHKDDTCVAVETRFELGRRKVKRNDTCDWDKVWDSAAANDLMAVPADIRVTRYNSLKMIAKDHMIPIPMEREVFVFWGASGTGKSRRAWLEAGWDAFPKDPCTKFWDGYQGHSHVVMDEFRGAISLEHFLRWCDRYPVIIEQKHGGCTFNATKIWITSNVDPRDWYPDINNDSREALLRRLNITHFN